MSNDAGGCARRVRGRRTLERLSPIWSLAPDVDTYPGLSPRNGAGARGAECLLLDIPRRHASSGMRHGHDFQQGSRVGRPPEELRLAVRCRQTSGKLLMQV